MAGPTNGNRSRRHETISLLDIMRDEAGPGFDKLTLITDRGNIKTYFHPTDGEKPGETAVIWVGGAGGGTEGPAHGVYHRLADLLAQEGIASMRLDYRHPNDLTECVIDVLVGLAWLQDAGVRRAALVGHSFGGAVVITAGALSPAVKTVVPLSSQTFGTELVDQISPRSLLFVHGRADSILPESCSIKLHALAGDPKKLVLYDNTGHGLDESREELDALLHTWLVKELAKQPLEG